MALTRLTNLIASRTGRMLYVNPDDFNASDLVSNNGKIKKPICVNSHKSMVEALLENDYYAVIPYFSVEKEIKE